MSLLLILTILLPLAASLLIMVGADPRRTALGAAVANLAAALVLRVAPGAHFASL
jgi:hypothetical protein